MRAIDTNVLVRLIVRDDSRQVAAAEKFGKGGAWVSIPVVAEAVWILGSVYKLSAKQLAATVEMLLDHEGYCRTPMSFVDRFRSRPSLGLTDCLIFEIARKAGHIPFVTFDRRLGRLDDVRYLAATAG